ncbi:MAG TPA: O-antigen ligase family protein, partial [Terriglobales bacterium]|nr:O-antigen ligase family protein [Terriglobales bacterium]
MANGPEEGGGVAPAGSSLLFYGFITLILFGPLAFGAVEDWAILTQQCAAAALFMVGAAGAWRSGIAIRRNQLYLPLALLVLTAAAQLIFHASAYQYASEIAALQYVAYYLIFFLANQVLAAPERLKRFVAVLTGFGFLLAVVSIVLEFASPVKLYGLRVTNNGSAIYGPYVNHSHYAGLMEMLTPFPLVMALRRSVRGEHKLPWIVAGFFMAASVFLSGSRGGGLAFACELVLVAGLFLVRNRSRAAKMGTAVAFCLLAAMVLWFGASGFLERWGDLSHTELTRRVRLQIASDTLRMTAARPVLGWG